MRHAAVDEIAGAGDEQGEGEADELARAEEALERRGHGGEGGWREEEGREEGGASVRAARQEDGPPRSEGASRVPRAAPTLGMLAHVLPCVPAGGMATWAGAALEVADSSRAGGGECTAAGISEGAVPHSTQLQTTRRRRRPARS
jgi:hypothetical protein